MVIFGPKPRVDPFGKKLIFDCLNFFFYSLKRRFFVLQYRKSHFPGLYCVKRKFGKICHFWTKTMAFGKMSTFRLFELFVFIAQKGIFWFQNIVKDIFLAYNALKEKLEKCPFLDEDHRLTPLEKGQFFDFLKFLFLQLRQAFF